MIPPGISRSYRSVVKEREMQEPTPIGEIRFLYLDDNEPIVLWPGQTINETLDRLGYEKSNLQLYVIQCDPAVVDALAKLNNENKGKIADILAFLLYVPIP